MFNTIYNPQASIDRINAQIAELEKIKAQIPAPPAINQTFQLAGNSGIKYANSIDDVNKEMVIGDTPFFSNDLSVLWIKNNKGEIKTFELNEIIQKDDKDLLIDSLKLQIEELKKNEYKTNDDESTTDTTESD